MKNYLRAVPVVLTALLLGIITQNSAAKPWGKSKALSSSLKVQAQNDAAENHGKAISGLIDHLTIHPPLVHENLAIFPISTVLPDNADYTTLKKSQQNNKLEITEKESASVPELKLMNNNQTPVFLMAGEVLTGAKQDRILAHDILISSKQKELAIPVYCVESGRWTSKSKAFAVTEYTAATGVRKAAAQKMSQGQVWADVAKLNESYGKGGSASMQESFEDDKAIKNRQGYIKALAKLPRGAEYAGVVVAINGQVKNVDAFSSPALFKALWPKLLEGYALEALRLKTDKPVVIPNTEQAQSFLSTVFDAQYTQLENPGQGAEYMIEAQDKAGSVLIHQGKVIHLALFPFEGPVKKPEIPTALPPQRWSEEQPAQIQSDDIMVQQRMQAPIPEDSLGSRSESFKKDGLKFEVKNPGKKKIKAKP